MVRWARRTEGRLLLLLATVVVVGLATGLTGAVQVSARGGLLDEVAGRSGPLTVAAVEVYQALSDADATSVSAFLTGGAESTDLRARYLGDIARANAALSTAATGAATGESAARVAELANYVPTYTGLVATARAYSRQGHPLGATYLRMASELVRTTMLPAAQRLYQIEAARLAASQARAGEPTAAGLDDLGDKRVCASAGGADIEEVAKAASHPKPVTAANAADCLILLQQGLVDAVSTGEGILAGLAEQDHTTKIVGPALIYSPVGAAMHHDATDLVRFVNGVLEQLRSSGEWDRMYRKWLEPSLGPAQAPSPMYQD